MDAVSTIFCFTILAYQLTQATRAETYLKRKERSHNQKWILDSMILMTLMDLEEKNMLIYKQQLESLPFQQFWILFLKTNKKVKEKKIKYQIK